MMGVHPMNRDGEGIVERVRGLADEPLRKELTGEERRSGDRSGPVRFVRRRPA